ncbi:hypothetical protein L1049_019535 [Liquidambar formosana]|uniref:Uncharacterized protein n=1 Tax=Liquidambar formosana TaxID=63359 RepID=A0AAP0SBV3_LIQFO
MIIVDCLTGIKQKIALNMITMLDVLRTAKSLTLSLIAIEELCESEGVFENPIGKECWKSSLIYDILTSEAQRLSRAECSHSEEEEKDHLNDRKLEKHGPNFKYWDMKELFFIIAAFRRYIG